MGAGNRSDPRTVRPGPLVRRDKGSTLSRVIGASNGREHDVACPARRQGARRTHSSLPRRRRANVARALAAVTLTAIDRGRRVGAPRTLRGDALAGVVVPVE